MQVHGILQDTPAGKSDFKVQLSLKRGTTQSQEKLDLLSPHFRAAGGPAARPPAAALWQQGGEAALCEQPLLLVEVLLELSGPSKLLPTSNQPKLLRANI